MPEVALRPAEQRGRVVLFPPGLTPPWWVQGFRGLEVRVMDGARERRDAQGERATHAVTDGTSAQ